MSRAKVGSFGLWVFCGILAAAARGQTPVGTVFTYQGQLKVDGLPANAMYDFRFQLFNASAVGAQVGGDLFVNDKPVENGFFTVTLDFGSSPFSGGQARWLEVAVRPFAEVGAYTPLSPRQRLTPTPNAIFSLTNPQWSTVGSAITNANTGFVGINRSSTVTGSEFFGIQAPVGDGEYGGMYIRTDRAGWPFYGYSAGGNTAWTYLDGQTDNWYVWNGGIRMTVEGLTGQVGIGTTNPTYMLEVASGSSGLRVGSANSWLEVFTGGNTRLGLGDGAAHEAGYILGDDNTSGQNFVGIVACTDAGSCPTGAAIVQSGHMGIGTRLPDVRLHVVGGSDAEFTGGGFIQAGDTASANVVIDNNEIMARSNGAISTLFLNNDGGDVSVAAGGTGRLIVPVIQITGADVAEKFPVTDQVQPGMVVEIDPDHPGQLRQAKGVYNRRVAGVVSGANGFPAGAILGNLPGHEDAQPIALTGRVYVWCDASPGAIDAGDLLTTSDTPGHAMKVIDYTRAQGAIIGKAMTGLKKGETGLVLTLISLQ